MSKTAKQKTSIPSRKVVIVAAQPFSRKGLAHLIDKEPDLSVCASVGTASQVLKAIRTSHPDLVLLDIMPDKAGLELIQVIRRIGKRAKILVLSMQTKPTSAKRVLASGGDGYVLKQEDPDEIIHAIRDVLNGHIYISEEVLNGRSKAAASSRLTKKRERPIDRLTDSELEILELLGRGDSEQEICQHLKRDADQINAAFQVMIKKLGVRHQNGLIRYAVCWVERVDA